MLAPNVNDTCFVQQKKTKERKSYKAELYHRSLCYCFHEILLPNINADLIYYTCNKMCIPLLDNIAENNVMFLKILAQNETRQIP